MPTPEPNNDRYNEIGIGYDETRKADPYLLSRMQAHLFKGEKGKYAEIGSGTGNYTIALHNKDRTFVGVEPSAEMINKAKRKDSNITWLQGAAEDIPLDSNSVDGVLLCLTIHHWKDFTGGMKEVHRVLKPSGRVVLFTTLPSQTKAYWLAHYFPQMINDSIAILPTNLEIETAFFGAGLEILETEKYDVQPDLQDQFLFCGKHNPELYFDERFRKGVSSFSLLAYQKEVSQGLAQLRSDIDAGRFDEIKERYANDLGDYLFVVGEKPVVK